MAKKITIQAKQVIDDEVIFDAITTYNSEEEFEAARREAIENWEDMQGSAAIITTYGGICGLGECLKLEVNVNDDYEEWNCIGYEEDNKAG